MAERDGFRFVRGEVKAIDRTRRKITIVTARKRSQLTYDLLVLTSGSSMNDFGIPGVQDYAFPLKSLTDVHRIHDHVRDRLRETRKTPSKNLREQLTFAVIGGGTAGVETVCALKRFVFAETANAPLTWRRQMTFHLIEGGPDILRGSSPSFSRQIKRDLERLGIILHLHDPVIRVEERGVIFASGERLATGCVLWTAGNKPNLPQVLPTLHQEQGAFVVDQELSAGPGILMGGDVVNFRDRNTLIPKTAQTALQMSNVLARNVDNLLHGGERKSFSFLNLGTVISLQEIGYLSLRGFTIRTRFAPWLRNKLYEWRFKQLTGQ